MRKLPHRGLNPRPSLAVSLGNVLLPKTALFLPQGFWNHLLGGHPVTWQHAQFRCLPSKTDGVGKPIVWFTLLKQQQQQQKKNLRASFVDGHQLAQRPVFVFPLGIGRNSKNIYTFFPPRAFIQRSIFYYSLDKQVSGSVHTCSLAPPS